MSIRLEARLCVPVMISVRGDGRKELIALAGGYRELPGRGATWSLGALRGHVPRDQGTALMVPL